MLVLGHRGVIDETFSQNSLRAFRQALDAADGFETDACLSKNGEVFLIHPSRDGSIHEHLDPPSAAAAGVRPVSEITAEEIAKLRLIRGEPIPTLWQALELVGSRKGKIIDIELKTPGVTGPVLALLNDAFRTNIVKPEAVVISSFDLAALQEVRSAMPMLKIDALFDGDMRDLTKPTFLNLQPDIIVMPEKCLTVEMMETVKASYPDALLCGWTVTEDGLFDPSELIARLKSQPMSGKIWGMIVDQPRLFVKAWRNG